MLAIGCASGLTSCGDPAPEVVYDEFVQTLLDPAQAPESGIAAGSVSLVRPLARGKGETGPLPALTLSTPGSVTLRVPDDVPAGAELALATSVGDADWALAGTEVELAVELNGARVHRDVRQLRPRARAVERAWKHVRFAVRGGDEIRLLAESAPRVVTEAAFAQLEISVPRKVRRTRASPEAPNVILVCVDTLRADALGCYGNPRDLTPRLDELAARGMRFEHAYAPSPWTWPSTASLFVGLHPREHGLIDVDSAYLSPTLETLAEVFQRRGARTAAFSTNPLVIAAAGFGQGFELFEEDTWAAADPTVDRALEWLDEAHPWRFFLYVHLTDPHVPYEPEPRFWEAFAPGVVSETEGDMHSLVEQRIAGQPTDLEQTIRGWRQLYDAECAGADAAIGRLIDAIEQYELGKSTLLVVTSDHGEEFLEHDLLGHGKQLFDESLRVPLIFAGPGVPVGESRALVENRHLAGTLCRLADLPCGPDMRGPDLFDAPPADPVFFSSRRAWWVDRERGRVAEAKELLAIQTQGQRLIWLPESPWEDGQRLALFRATDDDPMTEPIDDREREQELLAMLVDWLEQASAKRPMAVDGGAAVRAHLEELGYIGTAETE